MRVWEGPATWMEWKVPNRSRLRWSLSEFLNLLDTRSQCWGVVETGAQTGLRVRANENVMFYAMLDGSATISGIAGGRISLRAGEIAIIIANSTHAVRSHPEAQGQTVEFIDKDEYGDSPHHVTLSGPVSARVLCGRLKVRWPAGLDPHLMPPAIKIGSEDNVVDLKALAGKARGYGANAMLTRAAGLILIGGLRDHPQCQTFFRDANFRDPISRAIQFMELHLHHYWSVEMLASKVGMARSTFAGRFLAEVGRPPMEVLTELRMRKAEELLKESELKISEVGERVGYHSQSAFSRRFESHFKMTPGKMRAKWRTKAAQCVLECPDETADKGKSWALHDNTTA